MAEDWLVRGPRLVDFSDIVGALAEVDGQLLVRADAAQRNVVVVDDDEAPLVWIGLPRRLAQAPYDAVRLGLPDAERADLDHWTEATGAVAGRPRRTGPTGAALVAAVAQALATGTGGRADRLSAAPRSPHAATPGESAPADGPPDCPCDIVGEPTAILLSSRATVQLTGWLIEALSWAQRAGLAPVLLTPTGTRLTRAALDFVVGVGGRWVVADDQDAFMDGNTAVPLDWDGAQFVATGTEPIPASPEVWTVCVEGQLRHPYDADVRIGTAATALAAAVGLPAPMALGGLEPAEREWDPDLLTERAAAASPEAFTASIQGDRMQGQIVVQPQPAWIGEDITLWAEEAACAVPPDEEIAAAGRAAGVRHLVVSRALAGPYADVVAGVSAPAVPLLLRTHLDDTVADPERLADVLAGLGERAHIEPAATGDVLVVAFAAEGDVAARELTAVRRVLAGDPSA
ncbi:MAG: hypothetical protein IPK37_11985 [Austwickia sp.]|jgi:hypothetical protein|nr:MAG: hypothetical protein IPK37_11985 [Austwickia sp.]